MATAIDTTVAIDLPSVSHDLKLSFDQVQRTVELLDGGNTVPFITRYRKDQTGGLDEEQIRLVQEQVTRLRLLAERKTTILKSIDSQGKLTAELAAQIKAAPSSKRLEDLYLPFKPKKQSLATLARQRGLEPLADEIYEGRVAPDELAERATQFVRVDKQLNNIDEVIQGVKHLLAERFSEKPDLRGKLRRLLWRQAKLVSVRVGGAAPETKPSSKSQPSEQTDKPAQPAPATEVLAGEAPSELAAESTIDQAPDDSPKKAEVSEQPTDQQHAEVTSTEEPTAIPQEDSTREGASPDTEAAKEAEAPSEQAPSEQAPSEQAPSEQAPSEQAPSEQTPSTVAETQTETELTPAADQIPSGDETPSADVTSPVDQAPPTQETPPAQETTAVTAQQFADQPVAVDKVKPPTKQSVEKRAKRNRKKEKEKDKKRDNQEKAFKDYFEFSEAVSRIPPHRVLALNRGERAHVLRVKLELDNELVEKEAAESALPAEHPHAEFLKQCLLDALSRLVMPSLEREIRRELTEKAESHAVEVFAKNLRSLLLQPPIRGCRPLALDPGYRNGCKFSALDGFGNVLAQGVSYIVGKPERIQEGRKKLVETIKEHKLNVIAIGNGTACRETETLVAEMLANELKDEDVSYVVVNEAGASVYSTSPLGREELPQYDAVLRGAIPIGRRLLDPLSELVKINPANIGVGMYQHDVKAKHLQESLDAVVESCVNFVGVDVNTASPALLRYVSGLNQLTARRLFEHRQQNGPFKSREQLKEVAGFGAATFVQSAGFLKINDGDNPLDATWIHPESYEVAQNLLKKLDSSVADLATPPTPKPTEAAVSGAAEVPQEPVQANVAEGEPASNQPSSPGEEGAAPTDGAPDTIPESPASVEVEAINGSASKEAQQRLTERVGKLDVTATATDLGVGEMLCRDILSDLQRPGRDPREDLPKPIFRRGILKLEDLSPGMELTGTVLNVVDFGAFVDIGLHDTGLVHISRLANRFIKDPHEVVSVGDVITVWVHEIDKGRRRVSLTALKPGTEKPHGRDAGRQAGQSQDSRPPIRRDKTSVKKKYPTGGRRDSKRARTGKRPESYVKKQKPKPVTPITDGMADGSEPMRTFSDLAQFFQKKDEPEDGTEGKSEEK